MNIEPTLSRLGFAAAPAANLLGLQALYRAWCHHVPFDNIRKLIHVTAADPGILPGTYANDFFDDWLAGGTGGTCWAGNGALQSLLSSLGFQARRGVATMLVAPHLPPNHGTVIVDLDGINYVVDASILHLSPIALNENGLAQTYPYQIKLEKRDDHFYIVWTPFNHLTGLDCRIDYFPSDEKDFEDRHEMTRSWSPFNYSLTCRTARDGLTIGISLGSFFEMDQNKNVVQHEITSEEQRLKLLVERFGYAEQVCRQLPQDKPTPPPPGSKTAAMAQD